MTDNQEKQSKEQLILAAAEQEFLTKGYDGARTTSIAQAAGVTHAMLHYYFRTKEQLFERIVDEKFATMSHSMVAIMGDPSLPIVERIKGGIAAHFDFIAANPLLPRFVINEIVSRPERYEVLYKRAGFVVN
ncbi:MAG: TetR/AcrR family transcriptional regulator, partial [Rikenellaceae bacterium]|nr:TetR/AcrR family transcriptional regulator [Rikenellaceae bacterium]